jgi:TATA-box binding protein (TBP) (component of TFIID and TFIIIB)
MLFKGLLDDPSRFPVTYRDHTITHADDERIPRVVNVVTTAHFLPQSNIPGGKRRRYQFALHTLSMCFPVSQFKPSAFSSVITRLKYGDDYFTCLFFSSGRCVFVRCKSPQHSQYVTQQVRLLFNNLRVPIDFGDGSPVRMDVLGKYITLQRWNLENMVMSGNLGFRVCLPKLATMFAGIMSYSPKDFPGAWCVVYIRPQSQCTCTKTFKCGCKATVLVFDRGSVIVAGARTIQDGNAVYYRFADAMQDFVDEAVEFEKKARYAARVERFAEYLKAHADAAAMEAKALQKEKKRARKQRRQEEEEENDDDDDEDDDEEEDEEDEEQREEEDGIVMETLINESLERLQLNTGGSPFTYHKKKEDGNNDDGTLLAKACRLGQLRNVEWILNYYSRDALLPALGDAWDAVKDLPDTNPIKRAIVKYKQGEKPSK